MTVEDAGRPDVVDVVAVDVSTDLPAADTAQRDIPAPRDVAPDATPDVAPIDTPSADVVDVPEPDLGAPDVPEDIPEDVPADTPTDVPEDAPADVPAMTEPDAGPPPILLAAGDIASCLSPGDDLTANLLDTLPGTIAALGDLAYQSGASWEFTLCYGPTWGRHRARTRPAVGNHEYESSGARPYYDYFGAAAGPRGQGWYSYELGAWHIVVLNSNCGDVGGCGEGSPQERWLREDLAAHPARCTAAYMHHPRFSSGRHGGSASMEPFWRTLYEGGVDIVLAGHDHHYERFAPQDPSGRLDRARGIRQFLVGTGGIFFYPLESTRPNSEARNNDTWGVLELTLHPDRYDWRFVRAGGGGFTERGSDVCH